ncbi:hypothetical protein IV203_023314 [Nitzschia inconspicua]|uniref:Uncharacterized protein n=1 Tax=Nitzschia inconspicua TaxID=303405 RepID=A0A9K3KD09_9STRA|nr:hypothetical protein IV203_023314 [Nitzschia inconspicua]
MVLPLTDDAPKVTKEILGHALELTIHHPTIGPKICNKWITVDTIIDAIRAAAVIDTSVVMNARFRSMSRSIVLTEAICLVSSKQNIPNNHIISYCHRSNSCRSKEKKDHLFNVGLLIVSTPRTRKVIAMNVNKILIMFRKVIAMNVNKILIMFRKVIAMNVNKILIMFSCHGSNQRPVLFGICQRPTSFSGQDRLTQIVFQPLRDASNYFT